MPVDRNSKKPAKPVAKKVVVKTVVKAAAKAVTKPTAKPVAKTSAKPAVKAAAKPAAKPATKAKSVPASKTKAAEKPVTKTVTKAKAEDTKKKASAVEAHAPKAAAKKAPAKKATKAKSKKTSGDDEDLGDIEADLEGEPVVEAGAEKVKPLRMKISKAKERALMKEFGLDETVLSEEDMQKRRSRLKTLIKLGKTRGYLTHGEISDHLPDKLVDACLLYTSPSPRDCS